MLLVNVKDPQVSLKEGDCSDSLQGEIKCSENLFL